MAAIRKTSHKLVLLGDSAVGKSSLVLRFVKGSFYEFQESTIGAAFLTQTTTVDGAQVKFDIWDTAGQERYHSLAPMYYKGASAAVVVYDITNLDSYQKAKAWVKELQQHGTNMVIALAGNKLDLADRRQVDLDEVKAYAEEQSIFVFETSAKSNHQVTELFYAIAARLIGQGGSDGFGDGSTGGYPYRSAPGALGGVGGRGGGTIILEDDEKSSEPKKGGCCS